MTIRVLYFARLREAMGVAEATVRVESGATVASVLAVLRARPEWRAVDDLPLSCAVNEAIVKPAHPLHDGDVLALMPPVSGG